jgi:type III pantothenate kinase
VAQTFHALGTVKKRFQGAADTSPPERIRLETELARDVDLIIATCSDEVGELERMGVDVGHVRVVPCGVDVDEFTADGEQPGTHRPRLLVAGRMVPRKGLDTAIRALAHLPEAELVIAGGVALDEQANDPEAQRLRRVAEESGVLDRVEFVGPVDHHDIPALYRSADVVLATPWYEPFGITPLEAAACGRPLVGSAVGGLLDSVADGETGRLVPPRDPEALADAVQEILDDPQTARVWGRQARRRAVDRFSWETVAEATERALAELVVPPCSSTTWVRQHREELNAGMSGLLAQADRIEEWGVQLASALTSGSRLLAAGNGGSAAEAQHLTAELVGRFLDERRPLSAIALCAETSSLTAILNDYGTDEVFARQVEAHGRSGDVLVLLSTSGTSSNVLHAAKRARELDVTVWALTGPAPNPLASLADSALAIPAPSTAAVQEVHLAAVHALCAALAGALESERGHSAVHGVDA